MGIKNYLNLKIVEAYQALSILGPTKISQIMNNYPEIVDGILRFYKLHYSIYTVVTLIILIFSCRFLYHNYFECVFFNRILAWFAFIDLIIFTTYFIKLLSVFLMPNFFVKIYIMGALGF
jgi:hypothetical protein